MKESGCKRIAIVADAVYPWNKGGKEKRIYEITKRLAARGYLVTVYCMQWWKGEREIVREDVTYHAISAYHPLYAGSRRSFTQAMFFALSCLRLLGAEFDVVDVDQVPHLVLFTMRLVCLLKRKKMFATWLEVWGEKYWKGYVGTFRGEIAYHIEKISAKLPDIIVSISARTTEGLRTILGRENGVFTVPIGIDVEPILRIPPDARSSDIVYAGRLLAHKNVDVLLGAVSILKKSHPEISLMIVGDGPEKENLERLALELGIQGNVLFLGFLEDHDTLYGLMKASKVFVTPSTREGFGIVVIEANACGLPAIAVTHDQNAAGDLVTPNENGVLCMMLGKQGLADAIGKLLSTRNEPDRYVQYAKRYDWDSIIQKIESVYRA